MRDNFERPNWLIGVVSTCCMALVMSACGSSSTTNPNTGGTGMNPVPTAGTATLSTSEQEARQSALVGYSAETLTSGATAAPPASVRQQAVGEPQIGVATSSDFRVTKVTTETRPCTEIFVIGETFGSSTVSTCSGTQNVTSNSDEFPDSDGVPAGVFTTEVNVDLSVTDATGKTFLVGGIRTFTALTPLTVSVTGGGFGIVGSYRVSAEDLSDVDQFGMMTMFDNYEIDVTISPQDDELVLVFDGLRSDGRLSDLRIIESLSDDTTYSILSGSVVLPYTDDFVNVVYDGWNLIGNVPQAGSRMTVSGENGNAAIRVLSASGNSVTLEVTMTADGSTEVHTLIGTATVDGLVFD